jgi:hypothetical protein
MIKPLISGLIAIAAVCIGISTAHASERDSIREDPESSSAWKPKHTGFSLGFLTGSGAVAEYGRGGFSFQDGASMGLGIGLRGRYALDAGLTFGARLNHHFGSSDIPQLSSGLAELGWTFPIGRLSLEPHLLAGLAIMTETNTLCGVATGRCTTHSSVESGFALGLGVSADYQLNEQVFVGASMNALAAIAPILGFQAYGVVGVRL